MRDATITTLMGVLRNVSVLSQVKAQVPSIDQALLVLVLTLGKK